MQFNDTTNRNGLIQECEFLCGLGDTGISGDTNLLKNFTRLINARYYQVVSMIFASQDDWDFDDTNLSNYPVATRATVAGQRDYKFSTALWSLIGVEGGSAASNAALKILKLKRVDVSYDGSKYYKAEPLDTSEMGFGLGSDTDVDSNFVSTKPFYSLEGGALWLYPRPTAVVTAGIRVEFERELDEFTSADTTQEPGIDEIFHRMIAVGASLDFALARGLQSKNDIAAVYSDYEKRLKQYYGSKQMDRPMILQSGFINYE